MYNSNSFIMRDQVGDVVKNIMGDDRSVPFFKYLGQISIVAITAAVLF